MQNKVGEEIVSYCGKCKMPLNHVIVAVDGPRIKKLRCNTCGAMHGYKNPNLAAEKNKQVGTARKSAATSEPRDHHEFWVECMGKLAAKPVSPYKISNQYKMNDVVEHKQFGKGFVARVVDFEKIEVIFEAGVKLLVHGKN